MPKCSAISRIVIPSARLRRASLSSITATFLPSLTPRAFAARNPALTLSRMASLSSSASPAISRDMIRVVLRQLRDEGVITPQGKGRGAKWIRRQD